MSSPAPLPFDPEPPVSDLYRVLTTLRLAAYAADAMRVLMRLEVHATHHPEVEHVVLSACPDWHNPGALHGPGDIVCEVLAHLASDMQRLTRSVEAAQHWLVACGSLICQPAA